MDLHLNKYMEQNEDSQNHVLKQGKGTRKNEWNAALWKSEFSKLNNESLSGFEQ